MDSAQINTFFLSSKAAVSNIIPMLTTGTQPPSQASAVAVSLPDNTVVASNAVPTPYGLPFTTHQNQKYPVTANAPAPWVSVPVCAATRKIPNAKGIGLVSHTGANTTVNTVPQRTFFTPARA
jgi:hypothetical protein